MGMRALAALGMTTVAMTLAGPSTAALASGDATATSQYLAANYTLVHTARSYLRRAEAAPLKVLAQVTRECPRAAAGSPQDPQSTELSDEVIGAMVIAAYHLDVPGLRRFVSQTSHLHWSSKSATNAVRAYAAKLKVLADLAPPNLCADVRAWAASGYETLPASTLHFDAIFLPAWVAIGLLPGSLKPFESSAQKGVLARSNALEVELTDGEARAVESWGKIMNELELEP
ncbi:MAG TPA: hypothetical protein VHT29_10255 [Solirubrobacteraceae bacterium]|nr:hypothetical protein [Solirubrobacteraceae bacterium]